MLAAEGIDHRSRAQLRACNTTTMDMVSKQGSEQGSEEGDFQTRSATRCIGQAARRQEDWLAASQAARQTDRACLVCVPPPPHRSRAGSWCSPNHLPAPTIARHHQRMLTASGHNQGAVQPEPRERRRASPR